MYYVIAQDGQRYGPVDLATLNQWAVDNRVVPTTTIETPEGQRMAASSIPGIVFPQGGAVTGYGAPGGTPGGAPGMGAPGGFGAPGTNASGYAPYPHSAGMTFGDGGQKDFTISVVFSVINLLIGWACCPVLFGAIAIAYGNNAKKKGHPNGNAAFVAAIVITVIMVGLGFIIGFGSAFAGRMR